MDAADTLSRVTLHALHFPAFRTAWEAAVADATRQAVESVGWYEASVPVPEGMDRVDVKVAFALAVDCAVERELRARGAADLPDCRQDRLGARARGRPYRPPARAVGAGTAAGVAGRPVAARSSPMTMPVHVIYAIEVPGDCGDPGHRVLLQESRGHPFTFETRAAAEVLINASLPEGACAVELSLTARYPEP